jgi:hypothetical protein
MSKLLGALLAAATAIGCEGVPTLNAALAGTHNAGLYVNYQGLQEYYPITLAIEVNGSSAQISQVCPDNTGSLTATGSGDSASWSGTLVCPPVLFGSCSSVAMTYMSASVELNLPSDPGDVLTLGFSAGGTAAGCDRSGSLVAFSFGEW